MELVKQGDAIAHWVRTNRRITPIAFYFGLEPTDPHYFDYFKVLCRLAKAIKVVVITVRSSVPGTPFNEEIERLRELVRIGLENSVVVGILTETGRLTDSTDTIKSICKSVNGLGITFDPSVFLMQQSKIPEYESILGSVCHIRLRDSSRTEYQVRVGQGIIEFGRLVVQLNKAGYRRTLCVDLQPLPNLDMSAELRKMRLLLESLL
jgi:sugar phosphate isomerase/epimerase